MEAYLIKDKSLPIYGVENNKLISKERGCLSYGFVVSYPAIYRNNISEYKSMQNTLSNVISILDCNYIIHKQDFFLSDTYSPKPKKNETDLEKYNRIHFSGRTIRNQYSYIYITKVPENYIEFDSSNTNRFLKKEKKGFFSLLIDKSYISKKELETFETKKKRVKKVLENNFFNAKLIKSEDYLSETDSVLNLFKNYSKKNLEKDKVFNDNKFFIGDKQIKFYTLENNESLPDYIKDCVEAKEKQYNEASLYKCSISELGLEQDNDHVLNQYFYLPPQESVLKELKKKQNRLYNFSHYLKADGGQPKPEHKRESLDSERNKAYTAKIKEFKDNIIENNAKVVFTHVNVGIIDGELNTSENFRFKLKENTVDLIDLYFSSCPGNAVGLPADLYMNLTEETALPLAYFENYPSGNCPFGMRVVDPNSGNPMYWSVFNKPFENKIITNRNAWGVGKSGSGKTFTWNKIFAHEYQLGNHIFNIDGSSGFERSTKYHKGFYLKISKDTQIGMNPFLLTAGSKKEILSKKLFLPNFLLNLIDDYASTIVLSFFEDVVDLYYRTHKENHCFNDFYDVLKHNGADILKDNKLENTVPLDSIVYVLKKYYKGGAYEFLLNSRDEKLKNLVFERYITFQIKELKDDPKLFTIITFLLTNLYKEKLYHPDLLSVVKYLHYDESWTAMDKPILKYFIKETIKTVRSQNGATVFTSQDIEDFFSSDIIKHTVINNSELGVVSDLSGYKGKREFLKEVLSISDKQVNTLYSLGKNLPEKYNMRESAFIYAKTHIIPLGIEVSKEEKSVYESNPDEKSLLKNIDEQNNNSLDITAIQYAGN